MENVIKRFIMYNFRVHRYCSRTYCSKKFHFIGSICIFLKKLFKSYHTKNSLISPWKEKFDLSKRDDGFS